MLSAKRILTIFRTKGGSGRFTRTAEEMDVEQLSALKPALGGESLLIASIRSKNEWFALTSSRFIQQCLGRRLTVGLDQIDGIATDAQGMANAKIQDGGMLEVRTRDNSTFTVAVEARGPYFALLNLFLSVALVNRKPGGNLIRQRATRNEQRRSV